MFPVILLLSATILGASPPDQAIESDTNPERAARAAARRYESLLRRRAPYGPSGVVGGRCDEIIGRFCFHFGRGPSPPPPPEDPDVRESRRRAIQAHRRWLSHDPANGEAAGGLVRYLIEDGRAAEAVPAARTHAWASPGTGSELLLGLAHHSSGDFVAAETAFDRGRAAAPAAVRRALDDVAVLVAPAEWRWYGKVRGERREAYIRRFWAFSDPALGVPGNERRSAHYARHGWVRILEKAPTTTGMLRWGEDHAEVVLRYGLPRSRERVRAPPFRVNWETTVVSYYDPRGVPLVPEALGTEGIPGVPEPGASPELERDTVRSAYAPHGVRRLRGLVGQVTRFPTRDGWVLRVDAHLPPDTASPPAPAAPQALLTVLDSMGGALAGVPASARVRPDATTVVRGEVAIDADAYAFQLELRDDSTGLAGLARHRVELPAGVLGLSDPLIVAAGGPVEDEPAARSAVEPFPTRILATGRPVRVWAEVAGLSRRSGTARYSVEWWLESRREPSLLGRAVRWLGRRLGRAGGDGPVRIRWEGSSEAADPLPITFVLDLRGAEPGPYRLGLTIRDQVSGREATSYRRVLLRAASEVAEAAGGPGPS